MTTSPTDLRQAHAHSVTVTGDALVVDLDDGRTVSVPPRLAYGSVGALLALAAHVGRPSSSSRAKSGGVPRTDSATAVLFPAATARARSGDAGATPGAVRADRPASAAVPATQRPRSGSGGLVPAWRAARADPGYEAVLADVVGLVAVARGVGARTVNAIMTTTYWSIGCRIVIPLLR